jgi:hypothetical protein
MEGMKLVTGTYADAAKANRAVDELIEAEFDADEISMVVADRTGGHEVMVEHDTGVAEGAAAGALLGGALGALGATLVATGLVAAPGVAVWAAGPLLGALRGAVGGAGVTGLVGALAGLGFWKEEASLHAEDLREGAVLIGVHADGERLEAAREIFRRTGATRVRD